MQKENIAIMQISALLRQEGHQTDLVLMGDDELDKSFDFTTKFKPDIIGFSVMSIDSEWTLKVASFLKKKGCDALILTGGPHPTFFNDFILNDCIDIINIGEGEVSTLNLANAIDAGKDYTRIKNFHVRKNGRLYKNPLGPLIDINKMPMPHRDLYLKFDEFRKQKNFNFLISRGCPYRCNFCFIHQWKDLYKDDKNKNALRLKNVDSCIDEIQDFSKKADIETITFVDSTFNLNKQWTIKFLEKYGSKIGIPFTVNIRANLIDEEVVRALSATNCCKNVRMGVEVGSEKIRKETLRKNITNRQILKTAELLKKYNIKLIIYTMFGLPGERVEDALETISFCRKIKPYSFSVQLFHPYEGLEISRKAIMAGVLKEEDIKKIGSGKYKLVKSVLIQKDIEKVTNLMKFAVLAVKISMLTPVIRILINCPSNLLFDLTYFISSYVMLRKYTTISIMQ